MGSRSLSADKPLRPPAIVASLDIVGSPALGDQVRRHIFHIAYYGGLLIARPALLQESGYAVSSTLGNEKARTAAEKILAHTDAVLIGFSGPYRQRAEMLRWLKEQSPEIPVLVLQAHGSEAFGEADEVAPAEDPKVWLMALADCVDRRQRT